MQPQGHDFGMVGLGVMGRNMLLNMLDHGYSTAGLDTDVGKTEAFVHEAKGKKADATTDSKAFVAMLRRPRAIMLLVPAGAAVDAVISELLPRLSPGDILIDAGNSHFRDTDDRSRRLGDKGIHFLGIGVSGGELGARNGPSIMPGGSREAYARVEPILEDVAATVNGEACVAWLGPGSAGHFVKMVHNGIEYGLMQLIAEAYDLMQRWLRLNNDELHAIFDKWNRTELNSFLIEITSQILLKVDEKTDRRLVDVILDVARQKGTGKWTSQVAMDLQVPVPTIDAAVAMRELSAYREERTAASKSLEGSNIKFAGDRLQLLVQLREALYACMILTYCQGMALLRRASQAYQYELDLGVVARIWRGGCIIRAALLDDIRAAYGAKAGLANLLLDPKLGQAVASRQAALRAVVCEAAKAGISASGLMSSLAYFDGYRSARLPANLTQAQRDFFGSHTYERIDETGDFHTEWVPPTLQTK